MIKILPFVLYERKGIKNSVCVWIRDAFSHHRHLYEQSKLCGWKFLLGYQVSKKERMTPAVSTAVFEVVSSSSLFSRFRWQVVFGMDEKWPIKFPLQGACSHANQAASAVPALCLNCFLSDATIAFCYNPNPMVSTPCLRSGIDIAVFWSV